MHTDLAKAPLATTFRPIASLLESDCRDAGFTPGITAIFESLDRAVVANAASVGNAPDLDTVDVPLADLGAVDLMGLYVSKTLLPEGVVEICARSSSGRLYAGEECLEQAAEMQATGQSGMHFFCRVDVRKLREGADDDVRIEAEERRRFNELP